MSIETRGVKIDDVNDLFNALIANDPSWFGRFVPANNLLTSFLEGNEHAAVALIRATSYGPEVELALWQACDGSGKKDVISSKFIEMKKNDLGSISEENFVNMLAIVSGELSEGALVLKKVFDEKAKELERFEYRES